MEGSAADNLGTKAEAKRVGAFPHDPQYLGACNADGDARESSGTEPARRIEATTEALACASDPRLNETGVTPTVA
jgi:hypothetical protein